MRAFIAGLGLTASLAFSPAFAQAPAPAPALKTYTSAAEITALMAKAKAEKKEGQATVTEPILRLAPYAANLEYRTLVGPAAIHEKEAEMFYVIDGSGSLTTGGALVNPTRPNPENVTGTAVEGGSARPVAKGDFIIIPEGVPHWFNRIDGTLVLMSVHVPRQSAAPK